MYEYDMIHFIGQQENYKAKKKPLPGNEGGVLY